MTSSWPKFGFCGATLKREVGINALTLIEVEIGSTANAMEELSARTARGAANAIFLNIFQYLSFKKD
jgi:hypothetical protein